MREELMSVKGVMDAIVPISRFNKGEANKIFDEVAESGFKVVLKNNTPACVLIPPKRYEELLEALEDYELYFEAEQRMKCADQEKQFSQEEVYRQLGIKPSDLDSIEVDLD